MRSGIGNVGEKERERDYHSAMVLRASKGEVLEGNG